MTRLLLAILWAATIAIPLGWWIVHRRRVDTWAGLPVPAVLLDRDGQIRAQTGPPTDLDLTVTTGLPAPGRILRTRASDGTPVAVGGVRGGAIAVGLPTDPIREQRERVLGELGARLAHDINTPMAAIIGHLDLIAHEPISERAQDSVRVCQQAMHRMATMAGDLLTFTRLRAGTARREPVLAGALAEEAVAALLPLADAKQANLTVETPNERALVDVASDDLVRALRNLITNALTHGLGADKTVHVTVEATEDTVLFTITDSGPGLTPEQLDRLSQPLVRGEGPAAPGSGLGLTIVNEVLAAHGSRLEVDHRYAGPTLCFALPRSS
jgi:signal transduction histidine kinase